MSHVACVAGVRIIHGLEDDSPEISREDAESLHFVKNVVPTRLSDVRDDVRALFRLNELIAKVHDLYIGA